MNISNTPLQHNPNKHMESELSPDKEKQTPPVPLKTYQWEDLRRSREAGGYPWTHLFKLPLEGIITAEDIIRESTPRRSMSREFSRSRTRSPDIRDSQRILNLDSSPGSSRKHGEEGEDEGVHIPNFSKEISLDSEDETNKLRVVQQSENDLTSYLVTSIEIPKNVSPKSILKRRTPEHQYIGVTETRENTKCCHPLVNKIKHLADKTLHKLERNENDKSPIAKRKRNEELQEIRELKSSPGAVRRQKFSAIKLGDSDEMSKTMLTETPPLRQKKEHIYEDIEDKSRNTEKTLQFSYSVDKQHIEKVGEGNKSNKENESLSEKKSNASLDPSLVVEDSTSLRSDEHVMEKLHTHLDVKTESVLLNEEMDPDEPNVEDLLENQLEETIPKDYSPNITITEITDDDIDENKEDTTSYPIEISPSPSPKALEIKLNEVENDTSGWSKPSRCFHLSITMSSKLRRWTSEGGTPIEKPLRPTREGSVQIYTPDVRCACQFFQCDSLLPERINPVGTRPTSRASNIISFESDHEYEIIEKPSGNIIFRVSSDKSAIGKTDDDLSSTTSFERKYLQHASDEEQQEEKEDLRLDDNIRNAEALEKDIEDRFFINTPSTMSRTECEISTSQVDSSALENLPLKRDSRSKNCDSVDSKIQQRLKEGTGKLKTQAGKLKTKLQNMKTRQFSMPDRPKINFPDRSKFKLPERPKFSFPDRPKLTLPDKRKFSLPNRPQFKKINISEKLSLGDRKKFSFPERPKFNVPDMPKFKMPDRPKLNFPSLTRKKSHKVESTESNSDIHNIATVDFEAKTYPRLFGRKKKSQIEKTSSSPTLNREDTPPPTFTFTQVKKNKNGTSFVPDSPEQPREYGSINDANYGAERGKANLFEETYDFDKLDQVYTDEADHPEFIDYNNATFSYDISPNKQEYTHVINEINNDEFFVRPRGISRENIQVREYLSDEIRQAFKIPQNVLAVMGSNLGANDPHNYTNIPDADPELIDDDNEILQFSTEDLNDKDDGYYTFPPVRPSRAKRKKNEPIQYIDDSVNTSRQFSEVDLGFPEAEVNCGVQDINESEHQLDFSTTGELHSIHEYANDDVLYPDDLPIQSQTLPMPPKRKRKAGKQTYHSSLNDIKNVPTQEVWADECAEQNDIIVYRTEHEYTVPQAERSVTEPSPVPPRRNRSRSSRGTSICDDDRTSHGAESLTLDTQLPQTEIIEIERQIRHESPGYAVVEKGPNAPAKGVRRSQSKTPPTRRRKSHSSERKYYTVGSSKKEMPARPPRKKSSHSLVTLESITKRSVSEDLTQYVEIDEPHAEEVTKDLHSGEVISKMRDRPLPPPPRPPRGPKRVNKIFFTDINVVNKTKKATDNCFSQEEINEKIEEIEVSTQTDPLPDDVDFELGMDENIDISMSSSLKDIADEESIIGKSLSKLVESPRDSRPTSRSEKSLKLSDPKISELSKANVGRTSPTVILVERRVSSPTRINERDEMLTEASLTVQHIDIDDSKIPDVPPLPKSRGTSSNIRGSKNIVPITETRTLERVSDASRDIQLDSLITQRLQVRDLDVGRLNVSELQASKILVSDIEGMTLQVTELDSKSGHISVSGIEFSQTVIDEIVKKFAEISTTQASQIQSRDTFDPQRSISREGQTQTEETLTSQNIEHQAAATSSASQPDLQTSQQRPCSLEDNTIPPQRPPPPDLTPLLYSYLQDVSLPPASLYPLRTLRERPFTEFHEAQHQSPPPPTRRAKRKPAATHSATSSDEDRPRPSPRKMGPPVRVHEPTITEAGVQFLRVCQNSISRTINYLFNSIMSYISGTEDKKDVQMALVIFLVLIAGLIMFGLSDNRTIHHHHWEFFNPPDSKPN